MTHDDRDVERVADAIRLSQARDDEGQFAALGDLLGFSGENAARTVCREAARAALSAMPHAAADRLSQLEGEVRAARLAALEEAAVIAETWFDHHRPKQPEKSRFNIYDIEHWAKSATRLVAEDIRARAALEHQQKGEEL